MMGLEPQRRNLPGLRASPGPERPILPEKPPSRTPLDSRDLLPNPLFRCSERCLGGTRRAPISLNSTDSVGCEGVFFFRRLLQNAFRRYSERSEAGFSIADFLCDESLFDQNAKKREIPHFADSVRNDEFEVFRQAVRRAGLEPMKRLFAMFSRGPFERPIRRMMNSHSMECV